jgi:hypothetical protein
MNNEFSQKTKELFDRGGYMVSIESGRNWADACHHVLGRVSSSPYNCCPLNNQYEHLPEGRKKLKSIHCFEVESNYLKKVKQYLDSINYKPNENDLEFLTKYKKYYD